MAEKKDKKKEEAPEKDMKKDAKLTALKGLRSVASEMMGEGLKSSMVAPKMKSQVTVAADTKEGLKEGLEKAREIVPDFDEYMEEHEDETDSHPAEQGDEDDQTMNPTGDYNEELHGEKPMEDTDTIEKLEAKLAALKARQKK